MKKCMMMFMLMLVCLVMTAGMVLACMASGYPLEYVASERDSRGDPIPGTQQVVLLNPCKC